MVYVLYFIISTIYVSVTPVDNTFTVY